jgi:three-Cys-motif partner protein
VKRVARDGLAAREGGPWTQEKLTYLQRYATAFMRAMAPKRRQGKWEQLVYLDLLAGPGRGIDRDTGIEFDGSPLRALKIVPRFDRLYLGDLDRRNIDALKRRIPPAELSDRVTILLGDCNTLAREIVSRLSQRTLGLAFVDPEGFEVSFEMFQALAARQVDVLFLFPSGIGIARNLRQFAKQSRSPMDHLWGGRDWRDLPPAKLAVGKRLSPEEALSLDKPWVLRFRSKMADIGFQFQDEADACFKNEKNVPMYHLLFFSRHPAGLTIWRSIKKVEPSGQRTLLLE